MSKPNAVSSRFALTTFVLAALLAGGAAADDRDLLRESGANPYVFIVFDTSGSMHWTPKCTQEQFDDGTCDFLCPTGDCFAAMNGDDPASKFRQAKEALYEVIGGLEGINYGFMTYNQDGLRMHEKHFLYRVSDTQPDGVTPNASLTLVNGDAFPAIARHCTLSGAGCNADADCGARGGTCEYEDVFGAGWNCDEGTGDQRKGCYGSSSRIADMNDDWELRRAQRVPKLGRGPDFSGIASGEYQDDFDADSFLNDDGSLSWSGGWIESDHSGGAGPTAGNAQISGGKLRLDHNTSPPVPSSLARQANLGSWLGAVLEFDWEVVGGLETNDAVEVEISSNGGSSWTILERFSGFNNPTGGSRSYDVTAYAASNTQIRFRVANELRGSDEQFRVDNLVLRPDIPETVIYLRNNADGRRYKLIYRPVATLPDGSANRYGNPKLAVEIEVRQCTDDNSQCASDFVDREVIYYDLVDEYGSWDNGADRGPRSMGFFNQANPDGTTKAGDADATNTCTGGDHNDDADADKYPDSAGYNLRWPTDPDPPPLRFDTDGDGFLDLEDFPVGDLVPFDWEDDHKVDLLERLAPNTGVNPAAPPDFRVASYFRDVHQSGEDFLRLKDERMRPMVAEGATPLGGAVADFREWYSGCRIGTCPGATGWQDVAVVFDRDFNCRKKFLIVLTDGDNTCTGPSACTGTASLQAQLGIKTYVVAFGVAQGNGNTLTCMANNGGTGEPIYPQNKEELVTALNELFGEIKVAARSFASASVPTVQNETSDKIYLSSFTPLPDIAVWPGRVNAFRKPLPLKDDNTPDFDRKCDTGSPLTSLQASCHLWDASAELLNQAPTATDVAGGDYKIGNAADERRVLYSQRRVNEAVPTDLRLFLPPTAASPASANEIDLWDGLGLAYMPGDAASEAAARTEAERIVGETLRIKEESIPDPDDPINNPPQEFTYVLGDIFHADPEVLGGPTNLIYFRDDLNGYQDYAEQHFWRRKMLAVAANDGQLHFFDAGIRTEVFDPFAGVTVERFTDGTGAELFSYIPRLVLPIVRDQAGGPQHIYSLDGVLSGADVFIDPLHDGTNNTPADRGWRAVLVSGLREGGDVFRQSAPTPGFVSGYFALDVTQPDVLVTPAPSPADPEPRPRPTPAGQLVPSCLGFDADGIQTLSSACPTPAGADFGFPMELWSFTDAAPFTLGGPYYLDEEDANGDGLPDGNDERDLGDTWSKPIVGRIRICTGVTCDPAADPNDIEDRYVAIFGGGLEPKSPNSSLRGAWLYMVDVETGRAIYKRQLEGAAAAAPTVLDGDRDGYFDTIYIGTTLGFIYKVDLTALDSTGGVPRLVAVTIDNSRLVGSPLAPADSATVERVTDAAWKPFKIFSTNGRPIYMTITAFVVPDLEQFALAVGTGNRHNLWTRNGVEARFYVIVDESYTPASAGLPKTEASYAAVADTDPETTDSFLLDRNPGERGWVLRLGVDERVITQAFALVGVMVFTSFDPDPDPDPLAGACARSGDSRIFVVDGENANAFVDLDPSTAGTERYLTEGDFTTSPYVDQTSTKNPGTSGKTTESEDDATQVALQEAIRQALMRFFPEGCRYNKAYSFTVNASRSDTGHVRYATIPVAMCPIDWNEE
jgi:hypothetical protein